MQYIDNQFYRKFSDNWDDKLFRQKILGLLKNDFVILDVGAGAGIVNEMNFKGMVNQVDGIDLDERVIENKFLDKGYYGSATDMSMFPNNHFDLVFSDNVLEHIAEPQKLFEEVARVLKPGGYFINKTPNKYYYVSLIARFTPHAFHKIINKIRGREREDTFPTRYKLNSRKTLNKFALINKFTIVFLELFEGRPEYLRHFGPLYVLGLIYERIVNIFNINDLKAIIICTFKKTD